MFEDASKQYILPNKERESLTSKKDRKEVMGILRLVEKGSLVPDKSCVADLESNWSVEQGD